LGCGQVSTITKFTKYKMMKSIGIVVEKYRYIITQMPEKKRKYHLKSIHNFLIHFEELTLDSDREIVFETLNEYLEFISVNTIDSNNECKKLFYEYIRPVGLIYQKKAGFKYLLGPDSIVVLFVLINITLLILNANLYLFIIFSFIGILFIIFSIYKRSGTKVYQIGW